MLSTLRPLEPCSHAAPARSLISLIAAGALGCQGQLPDTAWPLDTSCIGRFGAASAEERGRWHVASETLPETVELELQASEPFPEGLLSPLRVALNTVAVRSLQRLQPAEGSPAGCPSGDLLRGEVPVRITSPHATGEATGTFWWLLGEQPTPMWEVRVPLQPDPVLLAASREALLARAEGGANLERLRLWHTWGPTRTSWELETDEEDATRIVYGSVIRADEAASETDR
jgi:hypothetical protein